MTDTEYDITHFRPEHESQVLDLLSVLWKQDRDTRAKLFRWKYLENPNCDRPQGIVALHDGRVVGFRGYFVNRYVVDGSSGTVDILHPGDTCVDPSHRNKNLSVAMGALATQYDTSRFRLFMNMTCSKNSLPGYMKMGFQPLAKKVRLVRYGLNPLRWLEGRKAQVHRPLAESRVKFGRFGHILVSNSPLPEEMASTIDNEVRARAALRLHQDRAFFAWRYSNPAHKYVFYFLMDGNSVRGYVTVDASPNNLNGEILDYGERDAQTLRQLLTFIIRRGDFAALSIFGYAADEQVTRVLTDLGFATVHPLKRLVKKDTAEQLALPLLIRPIEKTFTANDFVINGIDVRQFDNWRLKSICSDAA